MDFRELLMKWKSLNPKDTSDQKRSNWNFTVTNANWEFKNTQRLHGWSIHMKNPSGFLLWDDLSIWMKGQIIRIELNYSYIIWQLIKCRQMIQNGSVYDGNITKKFIMFEIFIAKAPWYTESTTWSQIKADIERPFSGQFFLQFLIELFLDCKSYLTSFVINWEDSRPGSSFSSRTRVNRFSIVKY